MTKIIDYDFSANEGGEVPSLRLGSQVLTINSDLSDHPSFEFTDTKHPVFIYSVVNKWGERGVLRLHTHKNDGNINPFFVMFVNDIVRQNGNKPLTGRTRISSVNFVGHKFVADVQEGEDKEGNPTGYPKVTPYCYRVVLGIGQQASKEDKQRHRQQVWANQQKLWKAEQEVPFEDVPNPKQFTNLDI